MADLEIIDMSITLARRERSTDSTTASINYTITFTDWEIKLNVPFDITGFVWEADGGKDIAYIDFTNRSHWEKIGGRDDHQGGQSFGTLQPNGSKTISKSAQIPFVPKKESGNEEYYVRVIAIPHVKAASATSKILKANLG